MYYFRFLMTLQFRTAELCVKILQLRIQLSIEAVHFLILGGVLRNGLLGMLDTDRRITGFGHAGIGACAHRRQQRQGGRGKGPQLPRLL